MSAVSGCYANGSLIDIAQSTGLIAAGTINITKLATDNLNTLDFSSVSSFNINSVLDLSSSPTSQISQLTSVNLGAIDTSTLNAIVNKNIPDLKSNLTLLNTTLGNLYSSTTNGTYPAVFLLLLLPSQPPYSNATRDAAALRDFQNSMLGIFSILNTIISSGGSLDQIDTVTRTLNASMVNLNATANTIINTANTFPGLYNNSIIQLTYFASNATSNVFLNLIFRLQMSFQRSNPKF